MAESLLAMDNEKETNRKPRTFVRPYNWLKSEQDKDPELLIFILGSLSQQVECRYQSIENWLNIVCGSWWLIYVPFYDDVALRIGNELLS